MATAVHTPDFPGLDEFSGATYHTARWPEVGVDVTGQRVSARDRLYLAREVPTLIIWGDRDRIIPVEHAYVAHELIKGSTLRVIPGADHFVPFEAPEAFLDALLGFIDDTKPAEPDEERFRELMVEHSRRQP